MSTPESDFASHVLPRSKGGHLLWDGAVKNGYGVFRNKHAHRFAFEMANGALEPWQIVHHTCDSKLCVNPRHLRVMTPKTHGHLHHLTWPELKELQQFRKRTQRELNKRHERRIAQRELNERHEDRIAVDEMVRYRREVGKAYAERYWERVAEDHSLLQSEIEKLDEKKLGRRRLASEQRKFNRLISLRKAEPHPTSPSPTLIP